MFSSVTGAQAAGVFRHVIVIIATYFLAKLNVDANTIAAVAASLATVFGVVWSIASKQPVNIPAIQETIEAKPVDTAPPGLMGAFNALPVEKPILDKTELYDKPVEEVVKPKRKYVRKNPSFKPVRLSGC